jgi:hypothetical protein
MDNVVGKDERNAGEIFVDGVKSAISDEKPKN